MQISISTSISQFKFGAGGPAWLLTGGVWDDAGVWDDSSVWIDGVVWTNPDLTTASYDSVSFSVASQETNPHEIVFKTDGTKFYVVGFDSDSVFEYNLSTAWNLATATYSQSFSVSSQETQPSGLFFKSDGTKLYVVGFASDTIYQYSLSTAWDVSTASYDSVSKSVSTEEGSTTGLFFKDDGTKVFIIGLSADKIHEYSLSTAWDISSASLTTDFSVASQEGQAHALYFNEDGTRVFIVGGFNQTVYQYSLSSAWDISTASYDSISFSVSSQASGPQGLTFKSDGSKMYVIDSITDSIYQYSV
jgi:DNA-binding beta-propeller fold protein YncE